MSAFLWGFLFPIIVFTAITAVMTILIWRRVRRSQREEDQRQDLIPDEVNVREYSGGYYLRVWGNRPRKWSDDYISFDLEEDDS